MEKRDYRDEEGFCAAIFVGDSERCRGYIKDNILPFNPCEHAEHRASDLPYSHNCTRTEQEK